MRHFIAPIVVCLATLATGAPSRAVPVVYGFDAQITVINDGAGLLDPTLAPGSFISATYTFESTTPDAAPLDPTQGLYAGALDSVQLSMGTSVLVLDGGGASTNIMWFVDDFSWSGNVIDGYAPDLATASATLDAGPLDAATFAAYLGSSDTGLFASDAIQTTQPPIAPSAFDVLNLMAVSGQVGATSFVVQAQVTLIPSPVPEPRTAVLVLLGLAILAVHRPRA